MIHLNLVQLEGFSLDSKISDIKAEMYKHTFQTLHASTLLTESQSSTLTHTHYHILKPVFYAQKCRLSAFSAHISNFSLVLEHKIHHTVGVVLVLLCDSLINLCMKPE